jgi:hypothetical protein
VGKNLIISVATQRAVNTTTEEAVFSMGSPGDYISGTEFRSQSAVKEEEFG